MKIGELCGNISRVQRCSLHDGPGVRTTIFFKGCPLNCLWCHNPECRLREPCLFFKSNLCVGCRRCENYCDRGGHIFKDNFHVFLRSVCPKGCVDCAKVCLTGALETDGLKMSVGELMNVIRKDKDFYLCSGGGITASGGEPLEQFDFLRMLFKKCKEENIHTTLDTSGYTLWDKFEEILPWTDLILYDLKAIDSSTHIHLTGKDNKIIIENLEKLIKLRKKVIICIPLIPDLNYNEKEFKLFADFLFTLNKEVEIRILPYHKLGISKYEQLGLSYPLRNVREPTEEEIKMVIDYFLGRGLKNTRRGR